METLHLAADGKGPVERVERVGARQLLEVESRGAKRALIVDCDQGEDADQRGMCKPCARRIEVVGHTRPLGGGRLASTPWRRGSKRIDRTNAPGARLPRGSGRGSSNGSNGSNGSISSTSGPWGALWLRYALLVESVVCNIQSMGTLQIIVLQ